ncbi:MAG TPA: replicative DNA helicase [Oligoflexia bacterium]|nr:replicative DNA helicase [Oligoflexia bacterium]HMP27666.1 replicative DNA helicase [Oligoflexia bacterium]
MESKAVHTDHKERGNSPLAGNLALRSPPHSVEAEEAVLGGILLDNQAINSAIDILTPEDFYRSANKAIFSAMRDLTLQNQPIDPVTLSDKLKLTNLLDESGGIDNLARLAASVPSSANVGYYAKLVKGMSLRRRVIHAASEIINESFGLDYAVEDFIDSVEQKILQIIDLRLDKQFYQISDIVQDSIREIEERCKNKDSITGVASGFVKLDEITAGFQKSDLIIIAARPSMGKTSLALNIAANAALKSDQAVALFSLEMSKEQMTARILSSEARINTAKLRTGALEEGDFPRLVSAAGKVTDAKIFIDDTPAITVTELRAKARRLHREHQIGLVIIDYLQLMRSPAYSDSREQEIADISRSLKALAKELRVPVVALSQLNRSVESRSDKRPVMSDLRESGAIEQDADLIMFIYRDEVYNPETTPDKGVAELIISKQRTGPTGIVRVAYIPEFTKFDNLDSNDYSEQLFGTETSMENRALDQEVFDQNHSESGQNYGAGQGAIEKF